METERDRGWLHYAVGIVLMLLVALGLSAQDARGQALDIVSPPWRLYTADTDSTISLHNEIENAIEAAGEFSRKYPGRALRMMPVGPWRIEFLWAAAPPDTVWIPAPPDTVYVELPADTVVIPCDCEEPGDTVVAPPDEPEEPTPDPDPDPDPDPLPDPGDQTWTVSWNAPAGTNGAQVQDPNGGRYEGGGNGGGRGESRVVDLAAPGPWGGTKALENFYGVIPAEWQPQVGTYWYFPQPVRELWYETWVRFGDTWEIGPDNPNYPGNYDHKVHFVMVERDGQRFPFRWEWKVGVFGDLMSAAARDHDGGRYVYMADPPGSQNRLRPATSAWDGQWHHVRGHYRIDDVDGGMKLWWDGVLVVNNVGRYTGGDNEAFSAMLFGGNRNQGVDQPMSFFFGPLRLWTSDPGWGG